MKNQLLLLEDVDGLGRKGQIVSVKPGFARNFLVPQKKGIRAEKHLIRMQERLQDEREKQAVVDRKESDTIVKRLSGVVLTIDVKVDAEKNMYGSVAAHDIVDLLKKNLNIELEKRFVHLTKPIREIGVHEISIRLKEGIPASIKLEVRPEEKPSE